MVRQKKYPDTATFRFYNANPKNRVTGDCVFRAIATVLEQSWEQTVMEMAELSCKTGYAINDKKGIEKYLVNKGWVKQKRIPIKGKPSRRKSLKKVTPLRLRFMLQVLQTAIVKLLKFSQDLKMAWSHLPVRSDKRDWRFRAGNGYAQGKGLFEVQIRHLGLWFFGL